MDTIWQVGGEAYPLRLTAGSMVQIEQKMCIRDSYLGDATSLFPRGLAIIVA